MMATMTITNELNANPKGRMLAKPRCVQPPGAARLRFKSFGRQGAVGAFKAAKS
jgi:hypothetical protein